MLKNKTQIKVAGPIMAGFLPNDGVKALSEACLDELVISTGGVCMGKWKIYSYNRQLAGACSLV